MNPVFTVFSAFLRLSLRVVFRPQPQPLQFFQRLTRLIFRSTRKTCVLIRTAHPALAVSALTPRIPQFVLLTCQQIPLFSLRTSVLRFRTARSACRCFVLVFTRWSLSVSRLSRVQSVFLRLVMAHVPRRSAHTTSHRTA